MIFYPPCGITRMAGKRISKRNGLHPALWRSVSEIPDFPFLKFSELQEAVAARRFNLGVDPLAAAEWSDDTAGSFKKTAIAALSLLIVVSALAALVTAFWLQNYWLLAALPVQAAAFYFSQPASPIRTWVTVAGVATIPVFVNLLFNRLPTAATLVAYAGMTFAAVRAAAFITSSAFRKALLSDEKLFLTAYADRICTVRDNKKDRVYSLTQK